MEECNSIRTSLLEDLGKAESCNSWYLGIPICANVKSSLIPSGHPIQLCRLTGISVRFDTSNLTLRMLYVGRKLSVNVFVVVEL